MLAVLIAGTAEHALACAICLSAVSVTPGQRMDAADRVVLATPLPGGEGLRVDDVIKGDAAIGTIVEGTVNRVDPAELQGGKPLLLLRDSLSGWWTSLGTIEPSHSDWLRRLVQSKGGNAGVSRSATSLTAASASGLGKAGWAERIVLVEPYLESEDALAAEIAFGELSRAPYEAMRLLRPALDAEEIRSWVDNPRLAPRHDAYLLLLGIAGNAGDAAALEERLAEAWAAHDATNLSAMLAAVLELRGPSRVEWIEERYLADRSRTLPEIEAALLALSVHGTAGGRISRQRIVGAYRLFIRERKPMAGLVAADLADWQAWQAVPDYIDVLRSNAVKDPAGRFAIALYLHNSPDAEAKAALAAFTAPATDPGDPR